MAYLLSGFADEYSANFQEQLEGFQKLGINYLELRFADGVNVADLTNAQVQTIKNKLQQANIKVSAIGSPIGKIKLCDDFETHLKQAERVFEIAKILDCDKIRMFSFYIENRTKQECKTEVIEKLKMLIETARRYEVVLCHENEAGIYGDSPESCLELFNAFKGELRGVFDMGNFRLCGFEPIDAYRLLKEYIEYFHIKDATLSGEIVPPGEGDAQIKEILKMHGGQKDVFVSLEPHLVQFTGLSKLASHQLMQKYNFETSQQAFTYATNGIKNILKASIYEN